MIPNWTNHCKTAEEKALFERTIYNSASVLERQTQIINDMERDLDNAENDPTQYSCPSWAAMQADRNGYRRALRRIKQLNNLDQRKTNG